MAHMIMCVCQVESLTASRNAAQAGTEPSDAIRVVNSVLTQLDQIKRSGLTLYIMKSEWTLDTTLLCTIHCCKSSQINNGLIHLIPNL